MLEAAFTAIAHRLNGIFARILRCFPLQSVRIAAEKRLVCQQKFSSIRRTLAMKVASKLTLLLTDLVEHHSAEGERSFNADRLGSLAQLLRKAALFV